MTDKQRGSDQLKLNCETFSALTQEELMQVAGGLNYYRPFPKGIPWPELFQPSLPFDPGFNPGFNQILGKTGF